MSAHPEKGHRIPWPLVLGGMGLVVIGLLIALLVVALRPSPADRLAMELDKASQPTPQPISAAEAKFTPGTYTVPNAKATDGAEVLASFYIFAAQGKIEEAMAFADNPRDTLVRRFAEENILNAGPMAKSIILTEGVTIRPQKEGNLSDKGFPVTKGDLKTGKSYEVIGVSAQEALGTSACMKQQGGRWRITRCPDW